MKKIINLLLVALFVSVNFTAVYANNPDLGGYNVNIDGRYMYVITTVREGIRFLQADEINRIASINNRGYAEIDLYGNVHVHRYTHPYTLGSTTFFRHSHAVARNCIVESTMWVMAIPTYFSTVPIRNAAWALDYQNVRWCSVNEIVYIW